MPHNAFQPTPAGAAEFLRWTLNSKMNKRLLQILTAILGAVPVLTGMIGLFGLSDPIYASANLPANALLDSNLRFLSGVWLGLGLAVFWLIPRIETQTVLFRVLWGMIFLGGIGRLLSMLFLGWPPIPFIAFTVLEIVGAPIFVAWQARLGK
jgi:hypothetical protein